MADEISQLCEILAWDSQFWGFPTARLKGGSLAQEDVAHIDTWCGQHGVRCLYLLTSAQDSRTTRVAEASGFHLVDVRVTLSRMSRTDRASDASATRYSAEIRPHRAEDVPRLEQIARRVHHDSRFYHDGGFSHAACDALYAIWVGRSCDGYADMVFVADLGGEPVGYISCHLDDRPRAGRIGLLGVAEHAQGQGIGGGLVGRALDWFRVQGAQEVNVVTQGRNDAAQRLYQRAGFATRNVELWYHKWYARADSGSE